MADIAANSDPRANANRAITLLREAVALHSDIEATTGVRLRDNTGAYQANWLLAMSDLLGSRSSDFDYLALLS